jgi:ABC-type nitrate/sulfonate/bicarbonate transport system substrate-binding protein
VILKQVGLDPDRDVRWAIHPAAEQVRLLTEGKIDAFLAFPPASLELREKKVGRVLLNSALDRPWAQYFCCAVVANRDFVHRHPVATKRAVRALLKSLCAGSGAFGAGAGRSPIRRPPGLRAVADAGSAVWQVARVQR